jgi:hypothetical protein
MECCEGVDARRRSLFVFLMTLPVLKLINKQTATAASGWVLSELDG